MTKNRRRAVIKPALVAIPAVVVWKNSHRRNENERQSPPVAILHLRLPQVTTWTNVPPCSRLPVSVPTNKMELENHLLLPGEVVDPIPTIQVLDGIHHAKNTSSNSNKIIFGMPPNRLRRPNVSTIARHPSWPHLVTPQLYNRIATTTTTESIARKSTSENTRAHGTIRMEWIRRRKKTIST